MKAALKLIPPASLFLLFTAFLLVQKTVSGLSPEVPRAELVSSSKPASKAVEFSLPASSDYSSEMRNLEMRPLFIATRRRPVSEPIVIEEPELVAAVQPVVETESTDTGLEEEVIELKFPSLEFRGFMLANNKRQALLYHPDISEEIWVSAGSNVDGWKVVNITTDSVTFEQSDNERIVKQAE